MTHNNDSHQQDQTTSSPQTGDLYRLLFEEAADSMFITDPQGRLLAVNSRAITMMGYSEEELLGMPLTALIPPEDLRPVGKSVGLKPSTRCALVTTMVIGGMSRYIPK